ncbi:transmembrane protein, putative [Rhizoctonia solani AG-3 Rhs1AP]|uniref:Transmembrane protein, putative n=1 Tax=Rhizoctonia solani AG-3 Rhs1AP TaxID=1086054 RepID=A0A0A1UIY4_9AGAM|nr:transmembrane protein, putative [Rhizoctonia solani AG-3 Rhs1AP]
MTTLVVTPTFVVPTVAGTVSYSLSNGVNTATEIASTALPTRLVFDTQAGGGPPVVASTELASAGKSVVASTSTSDSASTPTPTEPTSSPQLSRHNVPILAIILALVAATLISTMFLYLWYRKRARRRGHGRTGSEESGTGPPAGDVLRKLGTAYEKSAADPFSDVHASDMSDPFADPEKPAGSDSFLPVARPYTHAPSASTGSARVGKREAEETRRQDMAALNNLVRALDQKERQAQAEGRDRRSLPPVELFKAALIR